MTEKRCTMVLAAGQGTRMKSALPKVLHPIAGVPMVVWAVEAALGAGTQEVVVVVGHGKEKVMAVLASRFGSEVRAAEQSAQRGTADAVRSGMTEVGPEVTEVVITYGDVPCVPAAALARLVAARRDSGALLSLLTTEVDDPTGYGRILHDAEGRVTAIREHKDASELERKVRVVNPGLYAVDRGFLERSLGEIRSDNAQGEFYLTDLVAMAAKAGAVAEVRWEPVSLRGANDRAELFDAEVILQSRLLNKHRRAGCTISQGAVIEHDVVLEPDVTVGPSAVLRGKTYVASGAVIDVGCVLEDAVIGSGVLIKPYSVVTRSELRAGAQVGPFAHIRPESVVEEGAHVGNFVELKKTHMGKGSKANHLAYLGDGVIGAKANVGAGTIFCNYDGFLKHVTTVEEDAFVGSNSSLVAPVTIGKGAYVGSGSVVTRDVPSDALGIGRARQENKEGYGARLRERFAALKKAKK